MPGLRSLPGLHPNNVQLELKPSLSVSRNLFLYIKSYITNAAATIEFLKDVHLCIDATSKASSSLKDAIMFFDERDYIKSLANMEGFVATGNPFTTQLFDVHSLVVEKHKAVKDGMLTRKQKLTSKLTFVKLSRKVWEAVCKAALVLTLVSVIVLASLGFPPMATTAAATGAAVISSVEQWLDAILKGREEEFKEQMELVRSMLTGSFLGDNLETMRALVDRVENHLRLLASDVEFVVRMEDEIAVMVAIRGIRDRLTELDKEINRLETKVTSCITEIQDAVINFFKLISDD